MVSRSQSTPFRFTLLVAVLCLTLPVALVALDPTPPDTATPTTPAKSLPATGGPTETPGPTKDKAADKAAKKTDDDSASSEAPIVLPKVKPIVYNAERDADVARVVGTLLEQRHYLQTPISPEMSQRWLKNYLDALDVFHLFFLQSDIDEFTAKYGNNLGDLIHGSNEEALIAPAFEIYNRYMQRLNENVTLAEKLLHDKYDFTKDDVYTTRNNKSPWLQDAAASQATWRGQVKYDLLNGRLDKKSNDATIKRLSKRYDALLREGTEKEDMDVLEAYLNALTEAYDPHSSYFEPVEAQNFNILALDHSVTGIGAVLRSDDGYATIEEVIPGGPADLDKRLQPGDRILAVGQGTAEPVDAVDMNLNHVVEMIRGHKGSMVRLVVAPVGAPEGSAHKIYDLKRDEVSIKDAMAKAHILEHKLPDGTTQKFGVIDLHDFYEKTSPDVAKLIQRLKKEQVDGIILDLRGNGGGLLMQAADLTGLFVKPEPVVQIKSSDNTIEQLDPEESRQIYDGPLIVMVNKMSASATEIVAAALQDYGRAIIVGDQSTHGKGTVQQLYPLEQWMPIGFPEQPGAGSLKMTNKKFYRVAGGSTQQKGVTPDIILPSLLDAFELGETTLPYYLPWDTVPPANYEHLDLTAPYLPDLRANSAARVTASPDFNYLRQDIAYDKKQIDDKTVSLNEAVRLKQQEDQKVLKAARKKDLLARQGTRDKVLDLTLDMVDQNLPAAPPEDKKPKVSLSEDSDPADAAETAATAKDPTDDPQLDETVNIMSDYTKMLRDSGSKLVQATPSATK
jgi:carboxyl-terminal processing protease